MPEITFSGSFPHDLLDLNDWRWQGPVTDDGALGTEGDGEAVSVPSDAGDTQKIEKYDDDPWFVLVDDDGQEPYVRFRSPAGGATTSVGTGKTTRSELRETHFPDHGELARWDATDDEVHNLKVRLAVTEVMEKGGKPSRVVVAQVHKKDAADGIIVYLDGAAGKLRWKQDSAVQPGSLGDYTLGRYVNIGLSVHHGVCTIYVDDVEKAKGKVTGSAATASYFKTGCYNQDNHEQDGYPAGAVNEVHVAAVRVQHGTAWTSGGYAPIGPGVGAAHGQGEQSGGHDETHGEIVHGSKPNDLIQFNGPEQAWKLNLDIDEHKKHSGVGDKNKNGRSQEKSAKDLDDDHDPFEHPKHFEVTDDGTAVRFRSHLNGATTKGSANPRTELREMQAADPTEEAAWKTGATTKRSLTAEVAVVRAPSVPGHAKVAIGQIHTASDDLVEIQYDAERKAIGYTWPDPHDPSTGEWQDDLLIEDYRAGDWFTYRIDVASGTVRISVDVGHGFVEKVKKTGVKESGCYFKAGAYTQAHVNQKGVDSSAIDPDDYGEAIFRSIVTTGKGV